MQEQDPKDVSKELHQEEDCKATVWFASLLSISPPCWILLCPEMFTSPTTGTYAGCVMWPVKRAQCTRMDVLVCLYIEELGNNHTVADFFDMQFVWLNRLCPPLPQYGFNMVMSHPHAVNEIALSLNNRNPRWASGFTVQTHSHLKQRHAMNDYKSRAKTTILRSSSGSFHQFILHEGVGGKMEMPS